MNIIVSNLIQLLWVLNELLHIKWLLSINQYMCQILFNKLAHLFGEGSGTPLQYSCLENPMDGGAWQAIVHGVDKSRTRLSDFTFLTFFLILSNNIFIKPIFNSEQGKVNFVKSTTKAGQSLRYYKQKCYSMANSALTIPKDRGSHVCDSKQKQTCSPAGQLKMIYLCKIQLL